MAVPVALTIAGSDSSGGAGIQADLKTFAALGVYGASVITALTAQNTTGVAAVHNVPADFIAALHGRAPKLPVCGIAGIDANNAAAVIEAGADGVAVISALSLVPDPAAAARALRAIVDAALARRGR